MREGVLTSREVEDNEREEVLPCWAVRSIGAKYLVRSRAPDATHQGSLTRIGAWVGVTGAEQEEGTDYVNQRWEYEAELALRGK